jgi:hypothetical protein
VTGKSLLNNDNFWIILARFFGRNQNAGFASWGTRVHVLMSALTS